jgi:hypothetical protein
VVTVSIWKTSIAKFAQAVLDAAPQISIDDAARAMLVLTASGGRAPIFG